MKVDMGGGMKLNHEGVVDKFVRKYIAADLKSYSERTQKAVEPYLTMGPCDQCHGSRLNQEALACKIQGYNIADLSSMQVDKLLEVISKLDVQENHSLIKTLQDRLTICQKNSTHRLSFVHILTYY